MTTKPQLYKEIIDNDTALMSYDYLCRNIHWETGIYSRKYKKETRKAYHVSLSENSEIDSFILQLIEQTLRKIYPTKTEFPLGGIYLNWYRNGQDFCPQHKHPDTVQVVLSLGKKRVVTVGTKSYEPENGDAMIFGSQMHGVPMDNTCMEGRISIAVFIENT